MKYARTEQLGSPAPTPNIDAVCDAFEAAWLAGLQPQIHDYISRVRQADGEMLLHELLLGEWELRRQHGQRVELRTYQDQFPERGPLLTEMWNAWHGKQSEPLGDVAESDVATARPEVSAESLGAVVDRYKLLEKLGEGGFGTVWAAEQREPVKRRVALKVIKLGMDTGQVVARFEAERQALALMDHPNIAKVLDAGSTETGRPYFVMELVRGIPITKYCEQERLATEDRLDLFMKVCHAIQHAHQKGIIHRDIKPSNILVTLHDGVPVPKVIDFGIAKATQQALTEKTIYTQFQQFIGTPAYMSPEQAEMSGLDIDTRSDIYSLGVLLYELLTGATPFDAKELMRSGLDEMRKIIREREPLRPSSRLTKELTAFKERVAKRSEPPSTLSVPHTTVDRDLDWIVMKCLEKDRARRYDTANSLALDLKRHLEYEPVMARPPSTTYRLRKAWRRNKVVYGAGLAVAVALLVGLTVSLWQTAVAVRARRDADVQREGAFMAQAQERRVNFYMAFDRGLALCDQGHVGSGMLWLARALKLAPPGETEMERVIRANLTAWDRELHTLEAIYPYDQGATAVAISPDGTLVLTGAHDGVVHLWNRRTGRIQRSVRHTDEIHELAFSRDGLSFLTASIDETAVLWDTKTGQVIHELRHDSAVWSALFTGDGRIVTCSNKGEIRIWDAVTGMQTDSWQRTLGGSIHDLALSQDGTQLLGAGDDGIVLLWDLETHEEVARFTEHIGRVPTAAFVAQNRVAWADTDGNVYFGTWPLGEAPVKGQATAKLHRLHRGGIHRLRISEDGERLVTASYDNTAHLLNAQTGVPIGVAFEHQGGVKSVAFSNDGNILTASEDHGAREWRPALGSLLGRPYVHEAGADCLFTPDSNYLLIRSGKSASIRRALTREPVGMPFEPDGTVFGFAVSLDESNFMTGGAGGSVQFWDADTGSRFGETSQQHRGGVWAVAISQDGRQAISGGLDGVVKLWEVRTGQVLQTLHAVRNAPIRGVAISPNGSRIAIASADKRAWIVDKNLEKAARELKGHSGSVMTVAFSRDGQRVATGSWDKTVLVWNVETGRRVSKPMRHDGPFWYAVAFSADGRSIVAGCDDHTVRISDIATARPIGPKLPHLAALRSAAFTGNDSQIITGTSAGTTRRWDVSRTPMAGDVERIDLWLQVRTGMSLDANGEIRPLNPLTWQRQRTRLDNSGGPRSE